MASSSQNASDVLREEILADARREAEQMLAASRLEAGALLAKAQEEANRERRTLLDAASAEAARQTESTLSTAMIEAGRLESACLEALLQSIHDNAVRQLLGRQGFDYRECLVTLAADALSRMAGDVFVLKLSPADRTAAGSGFAGEVMRRVKRTPLRLTVAEDSCITDGGLVVQDADARQIWDNRLTVRFERMWPDLRRQLAAQAGLIERSRAQGGQRGPEPGARMPDAGPLSREGSS